MKKHINSPELVPASVSSTGQQIGTTPGATPRQPERKSLWQRYRLFALMLAINLILLIVLPETGVRSFELTGRNLLEMLSVLPPIFILLGLLDVWVKRETMVKYMGEHAGWIGVVIAYLLGSVAAGPLYAAFPVAGVLLRKGSRLSNVFIMLGAWSTTKIPLLLFEASAMGIKFTLLRLVLNVGGIAVIAFLSERFLSDAQKREIYRRAETHT